MLVRSRAIGASGKDEEREAIGSKPRSPVQTMDESGPIGPESTVQFGRNRRSNSAGACNDEQSPSRAHLSSLPATTSRTRLIYLARERYRTEQVYRECKQELGLDRYEGRKWRGFEHHVTVVLCCYAFLIAERDGAFPPSRYQRELARRAELQSASSGANG